jgi:hypothetical protein
MRQIGLSPKVAIPTALVGVAGLVLLAVALATGDDTLRAVALSALAAAGVVLPTGYAAPAGAVVHDSPPQASDDLLSPEAEQQIRTVP